MLLFKTLVCVFNFMWKCFTKGCRTLADFFCRPTKNWLVCGSYKNFFSVKSSEWLGQVGDWPSQSNLSWRGTWTASKAVALYAWQGRTSRWATHVTQCRHATLDKCFACSSHWRDTNATGQSVLSFSNVIFSSNLGQVPTLSESKKHAGTLLGLD